MNYKLIICASLASLSTVSSFAMQGGFRDQVANLRFELDYHWHIVGQYIPLPGIPFDPDMPVHYDPLPPIHIPHTPAADAPIPVYQPVQLPVLLVPVQEVIENETNVSFLSDNKGAILGTLAGITGVIVAAAVITGIWVYIVKKQKSKPKNKIMN